MWGFKSEERCLHLKDFYVAGTMMKCMLRRGVC